MAHETKKSVTNGCRLRYLEVIEVGTLRLKCKEMIERQEGFLKHLLKCKCSLNYAKVICVKSFWVPCMESPSQMPSISIPVLIESQGREALWNLQLNIFLQAL